MKQVVVLRCYKVIVNYREKSPLQTVLPGLERADAVQGWHSPDHTFSLRAYREVMVSFWQGKDSDSLSALPRGYRHANLYEVAALLRVLVAPPVRLWFPGVVKPHNKDACQSLLKSNCPHGPCKEFLAVKVHEGSVVSFSANVPKVFRGWDDDVYMVLVPIGFDVRKWRGCVFHALMLVMVFFVAYFFYAYVVLRE